VAQLPLYADMKQWYWTEDWIEQANLNIRTVIFVKLAACLLAIRNISLSNYNGLEVAHLNTDYLRLYIIYMFYNKMIYIEYFGI
jgi:hypothetical protein